MKKLIEEEVYAEPYNELAIKSDKYAGLCTELHLGYKNISKLKDFEKFISLDTLWLNDNRLSSIEGLEENFRIKNLFLHGNKMKSLAEGSFEVFSFLNQLTLYNNELEGLDNVLQELKGLRYLTVLDLYDNPIAQEDNYRLRVLGELTTLDTFDKHKITDEERIQAKILKKKLEKLKNFQIDTNKVRPIPPTPAEELAAKRRLQHLDEIVKRLKFAVSTRRLFLERVFLEFDRRKTGYIKEDIFWNLMDEIGLKSILDNEEQDLLLSKYKIPTKFKAMSKTGTRSVTDHIHYRRLCEDVVPPTMRVIENLELDTSQVPEISLTANDLDIFVKTVKKRKDEEEKLAKTRAMIGDKKETVTSFATTSGIKSGAAEFGLEPWLVGELNKVVRVIEKEVNPNLKPKGEFVDLNKQQVFAIFKRFSLYRKTPVLGIRAAIDKLFNPSFGGNGDSVSSLILRLAIGCYTPNAELPSNALRLVLKWRELDYDEAERLENQVGDEAMQYLDSLLRTNAKEDSTALFNKTISTGIDSTRLAATRTRKIIPKGHLMPIEARDTAHARADWFVIPNLRLKETLEKERINMDEWSKNVSALGLHGDQLAIALERKERSLIKSKSTPIIKSKKDLEVKVERKTALPPKNLITPKGWSKATGTIVI